LSQVLHQVSYSLIQVFEGINRLPLLGMRTEKILVPQSVCQNRVVILGIAWKDRIDLVNFRKGIWGVL